MSTKDLFRKLIAEREFEVVDWYQGNGKPGTYFKFSGRGLSPGYMIYVDIVNGEEVYEDLGV